MTPVRPLLGAALGALLIAGSAAAPALSQGYERGPDRGPDRGRWDWSPGAYELEGRGVPLLLPELRDSRRGHAFVMHNFDLDHDGLINPREARAANRAFEEIAGADRARFDWDRYGRDGHDGDRYGRDPGPPPPPPAPAYQDRGDWDRGGMRGYHFRQNRYGAVFNLEDVLFETGSAVLRPAARDRLTPLAGYLRAHPRQAVRIDGFTDSVGSDASNVVLSRDRARSVGRALEGMGIDPGRFQMAGHGETSPVATNATAAGRQQNRRVEVTLVGARASSFD